VDVLTGLEKLLADGRDSPTLRFALGSEYLKREEPETAVRHFLAALELDPGYSAAWKALGKTQAALGRTEDARASYERGISVAEARGDQQAAREMRVFLRRLGRPQPAGGSDD
jgi:Tfp pilus assembly protein PilF